MYDFQSPNFDATLITLKFFAFFASAAKLIINPFRNRPGKSIGGKQ